MAHGQIAPAGLGNQASHGPGTASAARPKARPEYRRVRDRSLRPGNAGLPRGTSARWGVRRGSPGDERPDGAGAFRGNGSEIWEPGARGDEIAEKQPFESRAAKRPAVSHTQE